MMKIIKDKKLKIEFTIKQEQNGKSYNDIVIPKGWKLFDIPTWTAVFQKHYEAILKANNEDMWIWVKTFPYLEKKGYVARFRAGSGGVGLDCDGGPGGSGSALGVLFW